MQATGVVGFSECLQTLFAGQRVRGFFFLGSGGSFHGQLGMGAWATKIVLGIEEPGIFSRSTGAGHPWNMSRDSVATPLDYIVGSATTALGFRPTVKNCGKSCGVLSLRKHSWGPSMS